jgi:hypothetical protein
MRILFEIDGSTEFAVSYDAEWNGYIHEELIWAEIDKALGGFMVRWENDFSNPVHFTVLAEAKVHIERNYFRHTPLSQGKKTFIK